MLRSLRQWGLICLLASLLSACIGGGGGSSDGTDSSSSGTAASLSLVPDVSQAVDSIELTALLKDTNNQPVSGETLSFNFLNQNTETLSPTSAVTGDDGTAVITVTDISSNGGQAVVQVTGAGLKAQAVVNFVARLADQSTLSLSSSGDYLAVGDTSTLTLTAKTSAGLALSGQSVSISSTGSAQLSATEASTNSQGILEITVTDSVAETVDVSLQIGDAVLTQRLYFGASLSLIAPTGSASADGTSTLTLGMRVRDSQGIGIAGATLDLNSPDGNALLSDFRVIADEQGYAEVRVSSGVGGNVLVEAQAGRLSQQATLYFASTPGNLSLSSSSSVLPINGSSEILLTLRNSSGQVLANTAFTASTTAGTLSNVPATTDANGQAVFYVTDSQAGNAQITVQSAGQTQTLDVYFGASLSLLPVSTSTGSNSLSLSALLKDAQGAPLVGQAVTFSLSGSASVSPSSATTGDDGVAATTVTNLSTGSSNSVQITAHSGQLSATSSVSFTTTASAAVALESLSASAAAYTVPVGQSVTIEARLTESGGSPAANRVVNVSASGNTVLSASSLSTDSNGVATFTATNTSAENAVVRLSAEQLSASLNLYFGASLSMVPTSVSANGSTMLSALLVDGSNTPLKDQSVTFSLTNTSGGNSSESLSAGAVTTNSAGLAAVTVTDVGSDGGEVLVTAHSGSLATAQSRVRFQAVSPGDKVLSLSSDVQMLKVGDSAIISASVTDKLGVALSGQSLTFSVDSGASLSATEVVTDAEGKAEVQISSTAGANAQVTASIDGVSQSLKLYFGASLALLPSNASGVADGVSPVSLSADVRDFSGAGIPGVSLNFRSEEAQTTAYLSAYQLVSDALGRASVELTSADATTAVVRLSAGNLDSVFSTVVFESDNVPASINLQTFKGASLITDRPVALSLSESLIIRAEVRDARGVLVKDGSAVTFSKSPSTIAQLQNTDNGSELISFTYNGLADAVLDAGTTAGTVNLTVNASGITTGFSVQISADTQERAISLNHVEVNNTTVTNPTIGVSNSSLSRAARVWFDIKDQFGNALGDGINVNFTLDSQLNGGENLSASQASSSGGAVSVVLNSGLVAGSVNVIATLDNGSSAVAQVTIAGGVPDAAHFSLAAEYLNIAGGVTFGLEDSITAFVGDRFGNVVADSTSVSFVSEGGLIGTSSNSGAFSATTSSGRASAVLQSAAPNLPEALQGIPPGNKPGFNRILAYTQGSESFVDSNGNGVHDSGESFTDLSEPYLDANDSGAFESGEFYIDTNGNGGFDGPNGSFNQDTIIWASMNVLFSSATDIQISPSSFNLSSGGAQNFVLSLRDQAGNPLVSGTSVNIEATQGTLSGATSVVLADTQQAQNLDFTLSYSGTSTTPQSATIKVTITSPTRLTAPGGNGSIVRTVNGTVQ